MLAAEGLAEALRGMGRKLREVEASRDPLRDTLTRRRSVLGEDDPETLATAGNLGVTLRDLGDLADRPRRRVGVALRPPPAAPIRSSPSASR
jgi:hypothetical protein